MAIVSITQLKTRRVSAGIPGQLVCQRAGLRRARLSDIERGYVTASEDELDRIERALKELITARQEVVAFAESVGYPL